MNPSSSKWRGRPARRLLLPSILILVSCLWILVSPPAYAIVDTNNNTLSDLWEQSYNNGSLFPNIDPQADPDGDGWTNIEEAAADTNPFDPNPPDGFLLPQITTVPATATTPETHIISWPARWGKQYTLYASPDLTPESWLPVGDPIFGEDNEIQIATQHAGSAPDRFFWRVAVTDTDTDSDGLTNAEEHQLTTNPYNPDTDGDSLTDAQEIALTTNPTNPDTDGDGLTDGQEVLLGTDPKTPDNPGLVQDTIVNGNFSDPAIGTGMRATEPPPLDWDYWAGIPGWTAVGGTNIEIQTIESTVSGDPYCELKAHPDGHCGIQQRIPTRKDVTYLLVLDCKDRADTAPGGSNFDIKINNTTVDSITFPAAGPWVTRVVSFKAPSIITDLSLVPSAPGDTLGCLVDNIHLAPVAIEDNTFATGVDNISITSNDHNLRGYQDNFWIMAPCGGQEYNGMRFKIPLDPGANLKIETSNATPTPVNITLGTAVPGPVVTWKGNGSSTLDHAPVWKIGAAQQPVELPIRVKNMKYRTVTVAVFPVRDPQSTRALVPLPPHSVLQAKMDETFGVQLNAWISLDYKTQQNYDYDPDGDGYAIINGNPSLSQMFSQPSFNAPNANIRIFVIDNVYLRSRQVNVPGTLKDEIYGHRLDLSSIIVNAGNPTEGIRSNQSIVDTIAHEIGHVFVGPGHPNDYNIELELGGNHAGPTPLPGTETSVRLMSGESRAPGARLLVKTEWDEAELWLKAHVDDPNQ